MDNKKIALKFLYTDLVIKNLGRDLQLIKNGPFKIREPYISFVETMISKAINERKRLKQLMYKNKPQIEFLHKQGDFVKYKLYLNEYVQEIPFYGAVVKKNVENIMKELLESKPSVIFSLVYRYAGLL